jgi:hypothetical protein
MAASFNADVRSAKLQTSYQNLSAAANTLNAASDAFGDAITTLDDALNKLNPGVTAWITISSSQTQDDAPWETFEERLGYAKVSGRWGLCLCNVTVDGSPEGGEETKDSWLFNDAPRSLRLRAIDRVPELIEALAREATHTAKRVSEGADFARQLAISISSVAAGKGKH